MLETKVMFNATEYTIKVSVWARGDPFPAIGHAVGIDTETELITDAEPTCTSCVSHAYRYTQTPLARERH